MVRFIDGMSTAGLFTEDEHAFFLDSFSLARDDDGRTVLRGLTLAETVLYLRRSGWRP